MNPAVSELQLFKADFFKALAHPVRIRLLELLVRGEYSVQHLHTTLRIDQPLVSQQLGILRAKNVVSARKDGRTVLYTVRDPLLGDLLKVAREIFNNHLIATQSMLKALRKEAI